MLGAWVVLAMALGWWGVVRAPGLTARTDNARRGLTEQVVLRGAIFDRSGRVLAQSAGERGDYLRLYPEPAAAPVVGYDSVRYGQAGIERSLDETLRGEVGHDPLTTWWSHLLTGNPPAGLDVRLTLDLELQVVATHALGNARGAVVVIDPSSGDVLALASSPSFDPNVLEAEWPSLTARPDAPLLNRATQGQYQPGGALGPFVLAWAQQSGKAGPEDPAPDLLEPLAVNGQVLACADAPPAPGSGTLGYAARFGCPAPFARLGALLGPDGLGALLHAFGLDRAPSIDLETGVQGPLEKPADAASLHLEAAGQGGLTVSPLQMARAFAALVSGGMLPELRLVDAVQTPDGVWHNRPSGVGSQVVISGEAAQAVAAALRPGRGQPVSVLARAVVGEATSPLAWYLGAFPETSSPRVVAVVLENGAEEAAQAIGVACLRAGE
jgi:peptidoglycan glycosyltransferase